MKSLPNLKGLRFLAAPHLVPLFLMIPNKLDYLEIFPSAPISSHAFDQDLWSGLRRKIQVDTLVLVDRCWGSDSDVDILKFSSRDKMIHYGYPQDSNQTTAAREYRRYSESETRLQELVEVFKGVKRLILRLDPRQHDGSDMRPKKKNGFAYDLGKCLSHSGFSDMEEIIFELARDDAWGLEPCSGKMHLVSANNCLTGRRFAIS